MTGPLWILVIPTLFAGFLPIESAVNHVAGLNHAGDHTQAPLAMAFSVLALLIGGSVAWSLYSKAESDPIANRLHGLSTALKNRLYFDEIFNGLIYVTHEAVSKLAEWVDRILLSSFIVKGLSNVVDVFGRGLRLFQTGSIHTYAFLFVVGIALVMFFVMGGVL
jgi:NADH-quinone oxidoreductase subunit L